MIAEGVASETKIVEQWKRCMKKGSSGKIKTALNKAVKKIIAEQKAKDGYLVTGDAKGNIKKIPAKDL